MARAARAIGEPLRHRRLDPPSDPNGVDFFTDWDDGVNDVVAVLRAEAGRNPYDKDLTHLIGELSVRSNEFRVRWARHNVKLHRTGRKRIHHPIVGEVTVEMEVFELPADPGQTLVTYTPERDSPSQEALELLASWNATQRPAASDDLHDAR